ncbi:hypothetical protein ABZ454_35375 [Streptomyces sp. NPDC005803]|uniref:hypothetical protein n=1 Tax=Streptomyces sp. NPDC005803 TaxID=3154297 RepID=UPI0033DED0E8
MGRTDRTLRTRLAGRGEKADSVAFSPDGATLTVGLTMSAVVGELWDVRTRRLRHTIDDNSFPSPQSASGSAPPASPFSCSTCAPQNNDSKAWDTATGERHRVVRVVDWTRLPEKPAFALSGNLPAADDGRTVRLWDARRADSALRPAQMRAEGRAVDDELLAPISPAHSENVNFFGTINVEVDTELATLDPAGYRPLRPRRPDRP